MVETFAPLILKRYIFITLMLPGSFYVSSAIAYLVNKIYKSCARWLGFHSEEK
jgi:hypothetical protein